MSLNIQHLQNEILEQYLEDDNKKPWIIGFSGGKDSTMLLQLVWTTIQKFVPKEMRSRQIYVICNNTLVENPKILKYITKTLKQIQKAAFEQSMPITVDQTTPRLEDSFFVNLIGKGYPAPNSMFRWCTERLKISPTTRYILDKINGHGEVIILLGTRSDESSNRAKSMKRHEIKGRRLRKHSLPNALVFAPIKDVITEEVWQYLLQVPSPWKSKNRDLVTLYRNASGGDCPLITDIKTPSCGQSRFGCWVCTVVKRDRSMEALIDNGEDWMEPLVEIRDFLSGTIDRSKPDYSPEKYRMPTRRNGQPGLGPYYPEWRKYILEQVLKAQKVVQEEEPELVLISHQELVAIQVIWYRDNIFKYNVADIYKKVFGEELALMEMVEENLQKEKTLLKECCSENETDFNLINDLLKLQKNKVILMNKRGLQKDIETKLDQYLSKEK